MSLVLGLLFAMIPRSASDEPVMTLVNDENVRNEITRFAIILMKVTTPVQGMH